MTKRLLIFALLVVVLLAGVPALAQEDDELECPAFAGASADVRTSYYMGEGAGFVSAGQWSRAIDSYSCIIEQINDSYLPAFMHRAAVYSTRRAYEEALADYTRAIELSPSLVAAFNNRGIIYAAQGEYALALADFDHALQLDSSYVDGYNNRAVIRATQGDYETAIADLQRAIELSGIDDTLAQLTDPERPADAERPEYDPDHAQSYALLGVIYSSWALDNYNAYLTLTGSRADERIESAAGALQSRFTFELRLEGGSWLLTAEFTEQ